MMKSGTVSVWGKETIMVEWANPLEKPDGAVMARVAINTYWGWNTVSWANLRRT